MTTVDTTQEVLKVPVTGTPGVDVTQEVVKALVSGTPQVDATQQVLKVVVSLAAGGGANKLLPTVQ